MEVTKIQLSNAITRFLENDVVNGIPDKALKIAISTAVFVNRSNPDFFEKHIFNNPLFSMFLLEKDGKYNMDLVCSGLIESMQRFGNLEIVIPGIPLLSKGEKVITLSPADVNTIRQYASEVM